MHKALDRLVGLGIFAALVFAAYQASAQPATAISDREQCSAVCLKSFSNGFENTEANLAAILAKTDPSERPLLEACIKKRFCLSKDDTCTQLCTRALSSKLDDTQKKAFSLCIRNKLCPGYKSPAAL